jgi:hypothetical protein
MAVCGVALAAIAFAAAAQQARKYGDVDTATVVAVDTKAARIVVDTAEGSRTFEVEPVTRILRGADTIELASVKVGDRVVVEARDEVADGQPRLVADRIVVVVDKEAEASKPK